MGGENLCEIVWNGRIVRAYFPMPLKAGMLPLWRPEFV